MPEQVGQVTGSAPPSAPVPRQVSQATEEGTLMVFWTPLKASSRLNAQVVAQVRAALGPGTATAATGAAHEIAEKILEHVREGAGEVAVASRRHRAAAAHAAFKGRVTVAVIGGLLVGVLQHVIGLVHLFELGFGVGIVGVAVGMQFFGLGAVCLFQVFRRGALWHPQNVVKVAFRHHRDL